MATWKKVLRIIATVFLGLFALGCFAGFFGGSDQALYVILFLLSAFGIFAMYYFPSRNNRKVVHQKSEGEIPQEDYESIFPEKVRRTASALKVMLIIAGVLGILCGISMLGIKQYVAGFVFLAVSVAMFCWSRYIRTRKGLESLQRDLQGAAHTRAKNKELLREMVKPDRPNISVEVYGGKEKRGEYYNPHSRVGYQPASESVKLYAEKYAVLDVETTGLSAGTDKIIEIAVVLYENGDEVNELDTLINPGIEIPQRITQLTGISDADVADAPNLAEVMPAVKEMIDDVPVIAHNAGFDMKFLAAAFDELDMKADIEYIDTLAMARKAYPGMPNHKLDTLIKELNLLDHPQTHRALDDVLATRKLYLACKATLKYTKTSPAPRPDERVAAPAPVYQSKKDKIRERIAAAEAAGEAYCPKCGSTSLTANKKGYGIGKGVVGAAVAGPIGLAAGNLGRQKVLVTCLNCGYQFKPGKK